MATMPIGLPRSVSSGVRSRRFLSAPVRPPTKPVHTTSSTPRRRAVLATLSGLPPAIATARPSRYSAEARKPGTT